ncbi:tRNA modification GTPase gtpbp3, mitochondrial [Mortierella hygrophila]|uniref:tRNA modification GTPase gtpbp3, mitochondrial n=1 Tax=Mortierella hygrophila TaxID=979708 RepID=A0A9P6EY21_9FUNG|nr:tRNA modification GTPase gtpbp3, mitochondrial [Mortierella hygrophila]
MDILATSSILPSEDSLVLKSGRPDDAMTPVDTLKTSGSSNVPNFVRVDVDSLKYSKDVGDTRGSTSSVSPQIQASAYIGDSETLSVPTGDTIDIEQGHTEPHPVKSTTPPSQTETNKHVHSSIVPTVAPTTILSLQSPSPPSQSQPETESTNPSSNLVASSAISILSASGTLVSHEVHGRLSTSTAHLPHPLSWTTTARTLAVSSAPFDPQQFKSTLQKLTALTEHFEALNDQLLDALTSYDKSRLGLDFALEARSHLTTEPTTKDESSTDLEIERRTVAQSLVELIFSSWSRLAGNGSTTTVYPTLNLSIQTPPPPQKMVRLNKPQIKTATHLKDIIVAFWSAQSNFQDRAQLVLEIFQDPFELEDDERVRILRSRHLNYLLSTSLTPIEADRLSGKVESDQNRMTQITEQLQGLWLEILLVLSKPNSTANNNNSSNSGDDSAESEEGDNGSFGKRLFRISKGKRQAFKNFLKCMAWIPRWTKAGINGTNAIFPMVSCGGALRKTFHICHSLRAEGRPTELRYTETHLDTIFALSTHPGKAGIAVVRVSGPQAKSVLRSMTLAKSPFPKPRQAVTRRLLCPQSNELLDKGMVVWFPGPRSFTGEDSVEFHCHGGKAVVDGVLRGIGNTGPFVRLAEPGEFSRRAFENNKLDLTEVEGLADLLNAETEAQRRLALRQADGGLKNLYETWRTQLIKSMALIEALIDFGEDENIEDDVYDNVVVKVKALCRDIKQHTDDDRCGEILRDGIHVTILGPPNAGKSSFLNFITKRQAAIVSPIPGTTRDVVEVSLDIGGYPILIGDTAGLRSSQDEIEMEGVRRAQDRIQLADINIAILPVTDFMSSDQVSGGNGTGVDPIVLEAVRKNPKTMVLINKMDLPGLDNEKAMATVKSELWGDSHQSLDGEDEGEEQRRLWAISCQTGDGIGQFLHDFIKILKDRFESSVSSSTSITQYRHRKHLENCIQSLDAFLDLGADDIVLGAEELRHAASDLGRITGRVDVEEVLDVVFREFCIGK